MTNLAIERVLAEAIKIREIYAGQVNAETTATSVLDDILEMLEAELVS